MSLVFGVGLSCVGHIYQLNYSYNRWLLEFPNVIISVSALYFYSLLHQHYINRLVFWFGLIVVFTQIIGFLVFSLVFNVDAGVNLLENSKHQMGVFVIRSIVSIVLVLFIIKLYLKIRRKYNSDNLYFRKIKRWSIFLIFSIFVLFPVKLFKVLGFINFDLYLFFVLVVDLFTLLFVLFRPRFLNRTNLKISLSQAFNRQDRFGFSLDDFELHFYGHCFYLNSKATLEEFGKIIIVSPELLSKFIYQNFTATFNDLVNKARVNYFVSLVSDGKHPNLTIEALAQLSGFGSRQSLYKQFKKFHGGNPSDLYNSTLR